MHEDDVQMSGRARAVEPAERWEIEGFDPHDPTDSTLVLTSASGVALAMPLDPDLLTACATVARAWADEGAVERVQDEDGEEPDDDEDEGEEGLGGLSRLTGWHQVSAFWDNLPDSRRRTITIAVVVAFVFLMILTQFL